MFRKNEKVRTWMKKIAFLLFIIIGLTTSVIFAKDLVQDSFDDGGGGAIINPGGVKDPEDVTKPGHDIVVDPGYDPGLVDPGVTDITGNVWSTISMVVMVFALGCIVVTGLRYMLASSDRKADIKQSSAYIIIGCIFIFVAMPIINVVIKKNIIREKFITNTTVKKIGLLKMLSK